jgi:rootletin
MQEEVELLQNALRDIAHAVIQDAESRDAEQPPAATHLHLTPAGPVPQRSVSSSLQFHFLQIMKPFGHEK